MNTRRIPLLLMAISCLAAPVEAQTVTPPPLPIGSLEARPEAGMSEPERKRAVRAHHHKLHHGRDMAHDDSLQGEAPAVQGGAGPVRANSDKGASSYFFGDDKKTRQ